MSQPVMVGREATHGTVAASFASAPINFNSKLAKANHMPEEQRGGQDVNFAIIPGVTHQEWTVEGDSLVYEDNIGFFLDSAFGLPVSTVVGGETIVWDSVFKFLDDPSSLSIKWTQPRRAVQSYQSLWAVVDKLTVTFEAGGLLKWSCNGVAMSETEVGAIAPAFSVRRPMTAWNGTVTLLGGAYTRLAKGSITISRNRKPYRTINNTADPIDFSIGNRMVEFDLTTDFNVKTTYDDFKGTTPSDALTVTWIDSGTTIGTAANPQFIAKLGTIGWESSEIDTGEDFPQLNLKGKAIYNATDASKAVFTLRSTKQYQTAVS